MKFTLLQSTALAMVAASTITMADANEQLPGVFAALSASCEDGMYDGQRSANRAWKRSGEDCGNAWAIGDEAEEFKDKNYPTNVKNSSEKSYNKCARLGVDAEVEQIEKMCFEDSPKECLNAGESAAEYIVFDKVCIPNSISNYGHDKKPNYPKQCREVAYGKCKGEVVSYAEDKCPDEFDEMSVSDMKDLQNMCEKEVDDLTNGGDKEVDDLTNGGGDRNRQPTKKPTKKPTPNKKPTRKPTKKPTKKPSNNRRPTDDCIDDKEPRAERNGRYKFKLQKSNAKCTDRNNETYEYGEFNKVGEFSECADACVKDVNEDLLQDVRGFDWNCKEEKCRCLYDKGTLSGSNKKAFDNTNTDKKGKGSIENNKSNSHWYCAKRSGSELFEDVEVGRALRGGN